MAIPYSRTLVGGIPWYSVLIVLGIMAALFLAGREEKRYGLPADTAVDLALLVVPFGIVGARLYYVAMTWEMFAARPLSILYVWEGGLAIYGGVIGGSLAAAVYARRKKLSFARLADMIVPGLLLAQAIGRWGNYFNMEAYGPAIDNPLFQFFPAGVLIAQDGGYVWHMATFFYESLWNFCGFLALWRLRRRFEKPGDMVCWYLLIYGSGRFIIEQLRQDSLYLGGLRVSQYVSLAVCVLSAAVLVYRYAPCHKRIMGWAAAGLWIARWALLGQTAAYGAVMAGAWALALGLIGHRGGWRLALAAGALALDAAGLVCQAAGAPFSPVFATYVHAALCSVTLPMGLRALCPGAQTDIT